jgi:hypothetical protein
MSELAYDVHGERFEVPSTVSGWLARLLRPRGAPELAYGRDGRPLTLPVEADLEDLREAVLVSGKYRLDPIDVSGKRVENVPPAYIQITKEEQRNADVSMVRASDMRGDGVMAGLGQAVIEAVRLNSEALRQNAEIAKCAVDRLPQLMEAMTTALNVASGTGLYAVQQRELRRGDEDDDADDDRVLPAATPIPGVPGGIDFNTIIAQSVSNVTVAMLNRFMPASLGSVVDLRKAHAEGEAQRQTAPTPTATDAAAPTQPRTPRMTPVAAPTLVSPQASGAPSAMDPATMMHFLAIQNSLGPSEREVALAMAQELTLADRNAWMRELRALSVPDAVKKVRETIAKLSSATPTPAPDPGLNDSTTTATQGGVQ